MNKAKKQYESVLDGLQKYRDAAKNTVDGVKNAINSAQAGAEKTAERVKDTVAELSADYKAAIEGRTQEVKEAIQKLTEERDTIRKELGQSIIPFQNRIKEFQEEYNSAAKKIADLRSIRDEKVKEVEAKFAKELNDLKELINKIKSLSPEDAKRFKASLPENLKEPEVELFLTNAKKMHLIDKINNEFEANTKILNEKLTEAGKKLTSAKADLEKAKTDAQNRYREITAEFKEKIDQKNKQIEELKARMEAAQKKAIDDAKRINEALRR